MNTKQLFDLTGRVAIITGGSVGLGRQMAEGLAEMGANLVLCARKKERCQQAAGGIAKRRGSRPWRLAATSRTLSRSREVVDAAVSKFGRIDILINNAGTSWGAPVEEMTLEQWNKVIETNLTGTFLFSQAVGKVWWPSAAEKSSTSLQSPGCAELLPKFPAIGYTPAKAGSLLHQGSGLQMGHAQHPGERDRARLVPNEHVAKSHRAKQETLLGKIPLGAFRNEQDLKGAAVFLASDASDFVTGHVLVVDGGQSA